MNGKWVDKAAEIDCFDEICFALGVSIVGAIKGAAPLWEKSPAELRVVAEEVDKIVGFIFEQLESIESEANDG